MATVENIESSYRVHGHQVLRRATRILQDPQEAQDVMHEVFALLLERPEAFRGESSLSTWLYGVCTRLCLDRLKKARNRQRLRMVFRLGSTSTQSASSEDSATVRDILARQSRPVAEMVVYYYLDGMSHTEISELLGCSRRTVGNKLLAFQTWLQSQHRSDA